MRFLINLIKKIRSIFFTFFAKFTCGEFQTIKANGYTRLTKNTKCGYNVNFNGCVVYGKGNVYIGDNFHSGKNSKILTEIHNYKGKTIPYDQSYILKKVIIEDNVWIGMGVTILGGVTIGEGSIIQAGSVVVKDIPKLSIAGGHPALVFAQRDKEHYYDCKLNKAFH